MRKRTRRLLHGLWVLPLLGFVAVLVLLHVFGGFRLSEEEIRERLGDRYPLLIRSEIGGVYVVSGPANGPPVLFIHGSPGSWDNAVDLFAHEKLWSQTTILSIDRPGYGGDFKGESVPSLARQAEAAAVVLADREPAVVVGHSLGASIAVQLAMDFPERVRGLVLVGAALDPDLEDVRWIQHVADLPFVSPLLPSDLRVCNEELTPLQGELALQEARYADITCDVVAVHGQLDRLVPVENMDFLRERLPSEQLEIRIKRKEDHFIPWTQPAVIADAVLEWVGKPSVGD